MDEAENPRHVFIRVDDDDDDFTEETNSKHTLLFCEEEERAWFFSLDKLQPLNSPQDEWVPYCSYIFFSLLLICTSCSPLNLNSLVERGNGPITQLSQLSKSPRNSCGGQVVTLMSLSVKTSMVKNIKIFLQASCSKLEGENGSEQKQSGSLCRLSVLVTYITTKLQVALYHWLDLFTQYILFIL